MTMMSSRNQSPFASHLPTTAFDTGLSTTPARLTVAPGFTAHEQIGFELGWDHAHHRCTPPDAYLEEPSPLRHGLAAGRAAFGARALVATPQVRRWLQLRLHAWLHGRSVELFQVTPHYLGQLDTSHCPITRVEISATGSEARAHEASASVDRVRNDAGYAAGNLAVMSLRANHAKGSHDMREAFTFAGNIERGPDVVIGGLDAAQWKRVAVLCSFVETLPHDQALRLPMLVLPPNRLRLFNPAQALQALVSQQLLTAGWSHRIHHIEALLTGKPLRRAFHTFFHTLLARVLEAGRYLDPHEQRWAVEDAWANTLVLQRWVAFAQQLSAAQCEQIVRLAGRGKLSTASVESFDDTQATDGWNVHNRGYVPHTRASLQDDGRAVQMSLQL
ncbi:MAG: hypothetical protein JWP52_3184 [Rhizobacter sp.]|nr:hypothetical protein [Rhizobacter sp.]